MLTSDVTFKHGDGANITHEERTAAIRGLPHMRYVEVAFSADLLRVNEPGVMVVQDCRRVRGCAGITNSGAGGRQPKDKGV